MSEIDRSNEEGCPESPVASSRPIVLTALAIGYVMALKLAEGAYGTLAVPSPFWLPDSVVLCALLIRPRREWWLLLAAMWPLRLLAGIVPGTPLWFQLLAIANDCAKAAGTAWLLQRILGRTVRLQRLNEFLVFLAIAGTIFPALSALAAAPARYALANPFWSAGYRWFLGDAVTQVIVTPALLYWCHREYRHANARLGELLILLAGLAAVASYAFIGAGSPSLLIYAPIPFLVWAAIRLCPFGTANAIGLVAIVATIGAARGSGVFAGTAPLQSVVSLQLFLLLIGVTLLSLSILVAERETLRVREREFSGLLLETQERERVRIARELHDDFGQRLALLQVCLDQLSAAAGPAWSASSQLNGLADNVRNISSDLHGLSHSLHPSSLEHVGLEAALKQLCAEFNHRHQLRVELDLVPVPGSLERDVRINLFRIAQEALRNVVKHSGATAATVRLSSSEGRVVLLVSDAGKGFDPHQLEQRGLGLVSMRERVRPFGGRMTIESSPLGTSLRAEIPLNGRAPAVNLQTPGAS
jgi:two-component system sensor histidine kinase UhpB